MSKPFSFSRRGVLGSELSPDQQREALSRYVHRYTKSHRPGWAREEWKDGKPYPVQFESDADWLHHTIFNVDRSGRLLDNDCLSRRRGPAPCSTKPARRIGSPRSTPTSIAITSVK